LFMSIAFLIGGRFLYLVYLAEPVVGRTYVPSLILLSVLIWVALFFYSLAVIGIILRSQRRISEESVFLLRKMQDE